MTIRLIFYRFVSLQSTNCVYLMKQTLRENFTYFYSNIYIVTPHSPISELFKKHELDMSTFASLSEADLSELGVTAFGARRKMLLVIQGRHRYCFHQLPVIDLNWCNTLKECFPP